MNIIKWFTTPSQDSGITNKRNFLLVQIDAIGIGLVNAASPFLPVFLARLNGSNLEISLLTVMPAITGLILAIPLGLFLQTRKNIIPWFSISRMLVILSYTATGLVSLLVPVEKSIPSILLIWALASIPQTVLAICFSVVMNKVAGPQGRYELMSHRWSILGITTALTAFLIGQVLDWIPFPQNFQVTFFCLSLLGLISIYFSSRLQIQGNTEGGFSSTSKAISKLKEGLSKVPQERDFINFITKRFVFLFGVSMTAPLLPIYFVREIGATDGWIAVINTVQTAVLVAGYSYWNRKYRSIGAKNIISYTTLALSLYPVFVSLTGQVWLIAFFAGLAGLFQGGLDLVFFDELMKNVPEEYTATFIAIAQSTQYLSAVVSPILGSALADSIGISGALMIGGAIRFTGFILFSLGSKK